MNLAPRFAILCLCLTVTLSTASAQQPSHEQLQGMYDDALRRLQASQDRKNELADENTRLQARVDELEKQVRELRSQLPAVDAARAAYLLDHARAWASFVRAHPAVRRYFEEFTRQGAVARIPTPLELHDPDWPFSAIASTHVDGATPESDRR